MERKNHKENPNSVTETSHQIHSPVAPHNYYYMLHATHCSRPRKYHGDAGGCFTVMLLVSKMPAWAQFLAQKHDVGLQHPKPLLVSVTAAPLHIFGPSSAAWPSAERH